MAEELRRLLDGGKGSVASEIYPSGAQGWCRGI